MPKVKSARFDPLRSKTTQGADLEIPLTEPTEQQLLAAYLADLLLDTQRCSEQAGSLLELAVTTLDPLRKGRRPNPVVQVGSGPSPVLALTFALQDLMPGTGPHFWVTMAVQILNGERIETIGTS